MMKPYPKMISAFLITLCIVSPVVRRPVAAAESFHVQVKKQKRTRKTRGFKRQAKPQTKPQTKPLPIIEDDPPRVVVKFRDNLQLPYVDHVETRSEFNKFGLWSQLQKNFPGVSLLRVFTVISPATIKQLEERARKSSYLPPDFLSYFYVDSPARIDLEALVKVLSAWPIVQTAYVYHPVPIYFPERITALADCTGPVAQNHLNAAPVGIDAIYAQTIPGGDGALQHFVDIERGWFPHHEALASHKSTLLCDSDISGDPRDQKHGTSVLGVIYASDNSAGCIGIAPGIAPPVGLVSHNKRTVAEAILCAILNLTSGDVILIEAQVIEPKTKLRAPVEINHAELSAIKLATELGFVVIEAGGNGDEDGEGFNLNTYVDRKGCKVLYRHPANPHFIDSGAILVSAATSDEHHLRLGWAPHGSRIDCYAWGEDIGTSSSILTGNINCYRPEFNGTSGASAIIAGAALAVQGVAQARLKRRFKPSELRDILSRPLLNTPANTSGERVGVMPNLRKIIDSL
jgi:serine protease